MALSTAAGITQFSRLLVRRTPTTSAMAIQSWVSRNLLSTSIAIPAIAINIPGLISDIWEGILKAVPKKKTSHMKKRHRQLAGKALKDVKAINECPGCGRPKRAHTLCPYCVSEIYEGWKSRDAVERETAKQDQGLEMEAEQFKKRRMSKSTQIQRKEIHRRNQDCLKREVVARAPSRQRTSCSDQSNFFADLDTPYNKVPRRNKTL